MTSKSGKSEFLTAAQKVGIFKAAWKVNIFGSYLLSLVFYVRIKKSLYILYDWIQKASVEWAKTWPYLSKSPWRDPFAEQEGASSQKWRPSGKVPRTLIKNPRFATELSSAPVNIFNWLELGLQTLAKTFVNPRNQCSF